MPTGQTIINNALTALGILDQGGVPSVSDSTDALGELNAMWDAWSIDEGLIYAIVEQRFPLAAGVAIYTIGPGGAFNTQIPARIYRAKVVSDSGGAIASSSLGNGGIGYAVNDTGVVANAMGTLATYTVNTVSGTGAVLTYTISGAGTGYLAGYGYATATGGGQPGSGSGFTVNILTVTAGGQNRNDLGIIDAATYYAHNDLAASAICPDEVYPDYNPDVNGFERLYFWPTTTASTLNFQMEAGVTFATWSLQGNYNVPPGFLDDLQYALAWRCITRFGAAVDPKQVEIIEALAMKAEARVRTMNAKNRQLPMPAVEAPGTPPPGQQPQQVQQ